MQIDLENIKPFLSPYLTTEWKKDKVSIKKIEYEDNKITGWLKIDEFFTPSDGQFHFTVPLAFIFVAQLGIIYGCLENALLQKPGEIFLREINIQCRNVINKTDDIKIELTHTTKTKVKGGIYYIGTIRVDNGAMVGVGKYILPLI